MKEIRWVLVIVCGAVGLAVLGGIAQNSANAKCAGRGGIAVKKYGGGLACAVEAK